MGITTAANSLFLLVSRYTLCVHMQEKRNVEFFSTLCEQHKVRQHWYEFATALRLSKVYHHFL